MAKKESTLTNMLIALMVITIVSGGVLGYIYSLTSNQIALNKKLKNEQAINKVLNITEDNKPTIRTIDCDSLVYNLAYTADNQFIGAAIKTSQEGFSSKIELMVGILADGNINKVSVLSQQETPGLGANMENEKFIGQFEGKNPANFNLKVTKDNGDVDAITAATISSRAFTKAVDRAVKGFEANKDQFMKGGDNE